MNIHGMQILVSGYKPGTYVHRSRKGEFGRGCIHERDKDPTGIGTTQANHTIEYRKLVVTRLATTTLLLRGLRVNEGCGRTFLKNFSPAHPVG